MPEANEISVLRQHLLNFFPRLRQWLPDAALQKPLEVVHIWTDVRGMEIPNLKKREQYLLDYAETFNLAMLRNGTHIAWARKFARAAAAIPDTHGLMIFEVWSKLPQIVRAQVSSEYDDWDLFSEALGSLSSSSSVVPLNSDVFLANDLLGQRWYKNREVDGVNFENSRPSKCKLAVALTRYCPPTWRGKDPNSKRHVPPLRQILEGSTLTEICAGVARSGDYYESLSVQSTELHEILSELTRLGQLQKQYGPLSPAWRTLSWDLPSAGKVRRSRLKPLEPNPEPKEGFMPLYPKAPEATLDATDMVRIRSNAEPNLNLRSAFEGRDYIQDRAKLTGTQLIPRILRTCTFSPRIDASDVNNLRLLSAKLSHRKSLSKIGVVWRSIEKLLPGIVNGLWHLSHSLPSDPPVPLISDTESETDEDEVQPASGRGRGRGRGRGAGRGGRGGGRSRGKGTNGTTLDHFIQNAASASGSGGKKSAPSASGSKVISASGSGGGKKTASSVASGSKGQTSLNGFLAGGMQTMAGVSTQLAKFGVPKKKTLTEEEIDTSRYLWPSNLFPILNDDSWNRVEAMQETGMEWIGVEYDPRDLILDLKSCYLEVELLLHTTPQIYTKRQWLGLARTPDNVRVYSVDASPPIGSDAVEQKRGFKIVIALEFKTHVLAFLSRDNNARLISPPQLLPCLTVDLLDIVLDFWGWCEFTVEYLKERGAKDDKKSVGSVLSDAGNQPSRGAGRYMRDETFNLAGIPPETLYGVIRQDPVAIAQVVTALRYVRMCQALNTRKFLKTGDDYNNRQTDGSHLLIRTTKDTVRFARELQFMLTSSQAMSDNTHSDGAAENFFDNSSAKTNMALAPFFFDPGEVAPAILLFDGLGPVLFGDWDIIVRTEGMDAITPEMRFLFDFLQKKLCQSSGQLPPKPSKVTFCSSTTVKNPNNSPPDALLFTRISDEEREKSTVEYIQTHAKTESVGPLAFCGHAVIIMSIPNPGMRKGTQSQIKAEVHYRSVVRKELRTELGHEPTTAEIQARTREKKKMTAKGKGKKRALEPDMKLRIRSQRFQERFGREEWPLKLETQASRLLVVKGGVKGAGQDEADMENSEDIENDTDMRDVESEQDVEMMDNTEDYEGDNLSMLFVVSAISTSRHDRRPVIKNGHTWTHFFLTLMSDPLPPPGFRWKITPAKYPKSSINSAVQKKPPLVAVGPGSEQTPIYIGPGSQTEPWEFDLDEDSSRSGGNALGFQDHK
ncbi:hypothetical protein C8F04DRAFT_1180584 [Mycena alexandri]|uniref:Uncharacterized protein n=1 Tax=Mycena alexandri TaxID=1745969 RepID=A0AAD6T0K8_9AGAR|nr:hypothetical protein C8F04DRAFT_1180584 [Mycena alexandri]